MNISRDEKIRMLDSSDKKNLLNNMINVLFQDYLYDNEIENAMKLFNDFLSELGYKKLNYVSDISNCKIVVADVKKFNSLQFIEKNADKFEEIRIDVNKDFDKNLAHTRKLYGSIILDKIVDKLGYKLEGYITQGTTNGTSKCLRKYRFIKINS